MKHANVTLPKMKIREIILREMSYPNLFFGFDKGVDAWIRVLVSTAAVDSVLADCSSKSKNNRVKTRQFPLQLQFT